MSSPLRAVFFLFIQDIDSRPYFVVRLHMRLLCTPSLRLKYEDESKAINEY